MGGSGSGVQKLKVGETVAEVYFIMFDVIYKEKVVSIDWITWKDVRLITIFLGDKLVAYFWCKVSKLVVLTWG